MQRECNEDATRRSEQRESNFAKPLRTAALRPNFFLFAHQREASLSEMNCRKVFQAIGLRTACN
jgi:hypothetical protein